jgi:hypothetical protein
MIKLSVIALSGFDCEKLGHSKILKTIIVLCKNVEQCDGGLMKLKQVLCRRKMNQ